MKPGLSRYLLFWLLGFAAFFFAVFLFRGILLPFVAGMATAYFLDPICDRMERLGLSRTWATTIVTLVFLLILVAAFLVIVPTLIGQLARLLENAPGYLELLREHLVRLIEALEQRIDPEIVQRARNAASESMVSFAGWVTRLLKELVTGGVAFANFVSLLVITPVVAFYLLRDWDRLMKQVDGWLPRRQADTIREQLLKIDEILAGFVRGQASVCLILAVFYGLALTLAGLDFGLVIGLIAGLLTFVPYVGALIGGLLSVGLALIQFDDWSRVAIIAGIFAVGQVAEGNFLTPKLVGDKVGLHPVWVIFALLAGGLLFGFVGILLALPVAAVIGVLVRFSLERYLDSELYWGPGGAPSGQAAGEQRPSGAED